MQIIIEITDDEAAMLAHDLLESPQEWAEKSLRGKINKCRSRLISQELPKILADGSIKEMPTEEDGLAKAIIARPQYKNRAQREAEAIDAEIVSLMRDETAGGKPADTLVLP